MTRLESWRKDVRIDYPEDIEKLRKEIPELEGVSDAQIQDMYSFWSEAFYCAGWHIVWPSVAQEFREWLMQEITEPEILW